MLTSIEFNIFLPLRLEVRSNDSVVSDITEENLFSLLIFGKFLLFIIKIFY